MVASLWHNPVCGICPCRCNRADADPHETPRRDPRVREQMDEFLRTGIVVDVCTGSGVAGVSAVDGSCQTVKRDGPEL